MKERTRVQRKKSESVDSQTAPIKAPAPVNEQAGATHSDAEQTSSPPSGASPVGHSLGDMEILPRASPRSGGQRLPPDLASRFARSLGTDLAPVAIHTDPASSALADSMNARAVTLGHQIHFGSGEYRPDSAAGQQVLAHEAVHVAQQSMATTRAPGSTPDALEREARALAPRVAGGLPAVATAAPAIALAAETRTLDAAPAPSRAAPPLTAPPVPAQQPVAKGPADVNVGFNAMDIVHKLIIAIDSSEVNLSKMKRHVDFTAASAVLANLTADEAKQVKETYEKHEGRTLENDLFFKGESGFDPDLTLDQWSRL